MEKQGKERLTIEDVRKHKGFEHRTDEEITAIIETVHQLSLLLYKRIIRTHNLHSDNGESHSPP
jgi:hypothetical protein